MPRRRHDDAGHVLVATGDGDVAVMVLREGHGLDAVGDEVPRLEGVPHTCKEGGLSLVKVKKQKKDSKDGSNKGIVGQTFTSHRNSIGNANSVVLPRQHVLLLDGLLYNLPKLQNYLFNSHSNHRQPHDPSTP